MNVIYLTFCSLVDSSLDCFTRHFFNVSLRVDLASNEEPTFLMRVVHYRFFLFIYQPSTLDSCLFPIDMWYTYNNSYNNLYKLIFFVCVYHRIIYYISGKFCYTGIISLPIHSLSFLLYRLLFDFSRKLPCNDVTHNILHIMNQTYLFSWTIISIVVSLILLGFDFLF